MISYTCSGASKSVARSKLIATAQSSFLDSAKISDVTPTFARVDKDKTSKWKKSSESYGKNVLAGELRAKIKQSEALASEINSIYSNIRQACSLFRYTCILRIMSSLRKDYNHEVMSVHTRKISRLLNMEVDVDEHISNISSHELSFFQKLVLCRGLKFAIPQRISNIEIKASFEKKLLEFGKTP